MNEIQNPNTNTHRDAQLLLDIERMQEALKRIPCEDIAKKSGAVIEKGAFAIDILFQRFTIDPHDFSIKSTKTDHHSVMFHSIVLTYLTMSDGTPPSNKLISFRELPDGGIYSHAFQGYAPDRIAKHFGQNIEWLIKTCRKIGGKPIHMGDVGFTFDVFPRIKITMVYYLGDDTFRSNASLLFDAHASHYMVTAGLATIAAELVNIMINKSSSKGQC